MDRLELKIPPLLLLGLAGLAMWLTARWLPALALDLPLTGAVAIALLLAGVAVAALGVVEFRRVRTTVNPMHPERSARVVDTGIYRFSRNPMYLGFVLALLALAAWLANPAALLWLPSFVAALTRLQIEPEERILGEHFGAAYADYCRRVRRWL